MIQTKKPYLRHCLLVREDGFTLMEIILSIVIIGIAIPSIMIPFSGLEDTKRPELTVQGSFIALKHMESIASKTRDLSPCAGITVTSDEGYTITCTEIDVASTDLDTDTENPNSFAKKVTLTITHPEMSGSLEFFTLFALDA